MEGRIKEEDITKAIISWLEKNSWEIICFDFPQSGTGKILHPNNCVRLKNKDSIIPDIVAIKNCTVLFFENKDRFVFSDFQKLENIKKDNNYSNSIAKLLSVYKYEAIYYGIGLPVTDKNRLRINKNKKKVDFIVNFDGNMVKIEHQIEKIF